MPAVLTALWATQAHALGGGLTTSAFLENRGWINPSLVPPPASGGAAVPGTLASEAWYVDPYGTGAPPWQVGAAGFARAEVLNGGTWDASVQQGTAALARAWANATGRAEATLSARWHIDVVINPLRVPLAGPALYTQLMDRLGCPTDNFVSPVDCTGGELPLSFLHVTQGAFQVTRGEATGRASLEETATLGSRSDAVMLQGGASFSSDRPAGSLGITWSGGWSDADTTVMPLHDGTTARLFPAGDPRNDLAAPGGPLTGVRLEALRPLFVSSGFQVGAPYDFGGNPLPFARFTFELEQVARAGWAFSYGFGTMAANFDDTAVTRLLGIEGLTLTDANGLPVPLAELVQVHLEPLSPVPEPAAAQLFVLGGAMLLAARRQRLAHAWTLPVMLAGCLGAATAGASGASSAEVVINGRALDAAARQSIESRTGVPLRPGRWWYDTRSGLWGAEGQGAAGFAPAGLDVGAPLPAQVSGGRAGVFFNGRNLADAEVAWLQTLGPVWPGRYWLDAMGNVGLDGQRLPFANLAVLASQAQARAGGGRNNHTPGGTWIGSDGGCVVVSGRSSSGIGSFGASNC